MLCRALLLLMLGASLVGQQLGKSYLLTSVEVEGLDKLPSWYVAQYGSLPLNQRYQKEQLEDGVARLKVRLEADPRILVVETDLVFYDDEEQAEVYLSISENVLPLSPGGGNSYFTASWFHLLGPASRLSAYLGYNLQGAEADWPYLFQGPLGLELAAGHQLQNPFLWDEHTYSDLFLRHFLYWHPLPELRWGIEQQVDAAYYWLGSGKGQLFPRWQVGTLFQLKQKPLAAVEGVSSDWNLRFFWHPLGQFAGSFGTDSQLTFYGEWDWFLPRLGLSLFWMGGDLAQGGMVASPVSGDNTFGFFNAASSLQLIFIPRPWRKLADLIDLGLSLRSEAGFASESWSALRWEDDFAVNVMGGFYLHFGVPVSLDVSTHAGAIVRADGQLGFAWNLQVTGA